MRNRMQRIANLSISLGALALVGCAWVQTPKEYAASHGYRSIDIQSKTYFCRREQPEVAGAPLVGVHCLTRPQLSAAVSRVNSARFTAGLPFDAGAFYFESPGISTSSADSTLVNGQGLFGLTGRR
jgi:hypothetical protein